MPFNPEDEFKWAHSWAIASGILLLVGFFMPILAGHRSIWPWDLLERAPADVILPILTMPLAGVVILAVARSNPRHRLPPRMLLVGGATLLIQLFLTQFSRGEHGSVLGAPFARSGLVNTLMVLAACGIAVGNRVRKRHPNHPLPKRLAGFSGIVVVAILLIPFETDQSLISSMVHSRAWVYSWPLLLMFLGFLAYGLGGIASFRNFINPKTATRIISLMGWFFFASIPISFLVVAMMVGVAPLVLVVIKFSAVACGVLAMPSAGAAAWLSASLRAVHANGPRLLTPPLRPQEPTRPFVGRLTPSKLHPSPPGDSPPAP